MSWTSEMVDSRDDAGAVVLFGMFLESFIGVMSYSGSFLLKFVGRPLGESRPGLLKEFYETGVFED